MIPYTRILFTRWITFIFLSSFSFPGLAKMTKPIEVSEAIYRPLKIAIPFISGDDKDKQTFRKELYSLSEITGVFYNVKEKVYENLKIPLQSSYNSTTQIAKNFSEFKKLGIESFLHVKIVHEINKKIRVRAKALDLIHSKEILYKEYILSKEEDFRKVAKKLLDEIHLFYTGKKGVFSTKIVFVGKKEKNSKKQVYTCDITGENLKQLTFGDTIHLSPSWSPDGSNILFTSFSRGNPDLYMLNLNSFQVTSLSKYSGMNSGGVFSPNGDYVIYTGSQAGAASLYALDPKTKKRAPITTKRALYVDPDFSQDGKWLAYVSSEFGNPHIMKAKIQKKSDSKPHELKLTEVKRLTYVGWYNTMPRWSPNGKEIIYSSFDRAEGHFDLFIMKEDGSQKRRLTLNSGNNEAPTWSPNGRMVMFHSDRHSKDKSKQLYLMSKDGTKQRMIDTGLYAAELPRWSL